jgi:CDP-diacylglycerol--glycerol-3-phosphate 3-phosphatidyltransferase
MKTAFVSVDRSKSSREPLGTFVTIPNLFSISRVFLLIPIFVFLGWGTDKEGNTWAAIFMGIAVLTDFLDGAAARWLNQTSKWGRILDPVCDKICIVSIGLFLALPSRAYPIPVWFIVLIVVRDLTILAGAYYLMGKLHYVPTSMAVGKWTTCFLAMLLISFTLEWMPNQPWLFVFRMDVLLWLCTIMVLISGVIYAYRTIRAGSMEQAESLRQNSVKSGTKQPEKRLE